MTIRIACIIPARGGSRRIPGKNIMQFCGKPLIAWSIEQARASKHIEDIYVSSDDDDILRVAKEYGALTIKRPEELATDLSLSEDALIHALDYMDNPVVVVFLQATSPVRTSEDIEDALMQFKIAKVDSLFSISPLNEENGSIYIFNAEMFKKYKNRKAGQSMIYNMPKWKSHEIDCRDDIRICERYMRSRGDIAVMD